MSHLDICISHGHLKRIIWDPNQPQIFDSAAIWWLSPWPDPNLFLCNSALVFLHLTGSTDRNTESSHWYLNPFSRLRGEAGVGGGSGVVGVLSPAASCPWIEMTSPSAPGKPWSWMTMCVVFTVFPTWARDPADSNPWEVATNTWGWSAVLRATGTTSDLDASSTVKNANLWQQHSCCLKNWQIPHLENFYKEPNQATNCSLSETKELDGGRGQRREEEKKTLMRKKKKRQEERKWGEVGKKVHENCLLASLIKDTHHQIYWAVLNLICDTASIFGLWGSSASKSASKLYRLSCNTNLMGDN